MTIYRFLEIKMNKKVKAQLEKKKEINKDHSKNITKK